MHGNLNLLEPSTDFLVFSEQLLPQRLPFLLESSRSFLLGVFRMYQFRHFKSTAIFDSLLWNCEHYLTKGGEG